MKKLLTVLLIVSLVASFAACGTVDNSNTGATTSVEQNDSAATKETEAANDAETTKPEETEPATTEKTTEQTEAKDSGLVDGMRPEFKEAMDAYEEFYVDYVAFMKKYKENPTDLTLLSNYASMVSDAAEMEKKFAAWDQGEMNAAEVQYYLDVSARVLKMLAEVAA